MLFVEVYMADVVGVVLTVIVSVTVPVPTLILVALQLARLGRPEQPIVTAPVNPATGVRVRLYVADAPAEIA